MDGRCNLNNLEYRTACTIKISQHGNVDIRGLMKAEIVNARDEIQAVLGDIRESMRPLQFLSIPIRSEQIKERFNLFKSEILSENNAADSQKSIFISSDKLHLTIAVFCLLDADERSEGIKALNEYKQKILSPLIEKTGPLKMIISGVECMETNLAAAHVVYANARLEAETEELSLQSIANGMSDFFYEKGLVKDYKENVKLHVTLINSKYRKNLVNSPERRYVKRRPFNATDLIEKYKDFYFGECLLNEVHLSVMSTVGTDGFYQPLSVVKV